MMASCKKNANVLSIGLWTLDFMLSNNWWKTTHAMKTFPKFVSLACIEKNLMDQYRSTMLEECPASAHIWMALAKALAEACKPKLWEAIKPKVGKQERLTFQCFVYAHKLTCKPPSDIYED